MIRRFLVSVLPLLGLLVAQTSAPATKPVERWAAGSVAAIEADVIRKVDGAKPSFTILTQTPTSIAAVLHRARTGDAELHEEMADFFVVRSGSATLIVGGELIGDRLTSKGEHLASGIRGGTPHKLEPGDILHIPPKVPHHVTVAPGQSVTYLLIKAKE